ADALSVAGQADGSAAQVLARLKVVERGNRVQVIVLRGAAAGRGRQRHNRVPTLNEVSGERAGGRKLPPAGSRREHKRGQRARSRGKPEIGRDGAARVGVVKRER